MVEKQCVICNKTYLIDKEDTNNLCHECYCNLYDTTKTLNDKLEYLKGLLNE